MTVLIFVHLNIIYNYTINSNLLIYSKHGQVKTNYFFFLNKKYIYIYIYIYIQQTN